MYEGGDINSFDGQGTFDRPGAIMSSSPDEQQNTVQRSSNPFSSRPRTANPNQNYLAAKKLAANQNAPQFFRDAAMASTPAPVQKEPARFNKMPIIIGAGVIGLIAVVAILVVTLSGGGIGKGEIDTAVAGKMNTAGLFDKDAPVPFRGDSKIGSYGYINPSSGKMVIEHLFSTAGPFYGNYARAIQKDRNVIINRKGEVLVKAGKDVKISYDIDENIWVVGHDIYNGKIKKANPENTEASYSGHGYAFVAPQTDEDNSPYLVSVETGEKIFQCEDIGCGFVTSSDTTGEKTYIIMQERKKAAKIYDASSKQEVYGASSTNKIAKLGEGVFVESSRSTGDVVKYITITGSEVSTSSKEPKSDFDRSISRSGKYFSESCSDGYKITNASGGEVVGCELWQVWELSLSVYRKYESEGKEVVLFLKEDGVHLYDMKGGKDIKVYKGAGDIEPYKNSAFAKLTDAKGKMLICNLFEPKQDCMTYKKGKVKAYPTFLIIDEKTYSYKLKEVRYAESKK